MADQFTITDTKIRPNAINSLIALLYHPSVQDALREALSKIVEDDIQDALRAAVIKIVEDDINRHGLSARAVEMLLRPYVRFR